MSYDTSHITKLGHLKALAQKSLLKISEIAFACADALEEMENAKADKVSKKSISVATSLWVANTDAETKAAGYEYKADVAVTGLKERDDMELCFSVPSLSPAASSGVSQTMHTFDGSIRLFAVSKPSSVLTGVLTITQGETTT